MSGPFKYVNAINDKTEIEFDETEYIPYLVNKAYSFHIDTVLFANEMNVFHDLDKKMQYDFYYHALSKRRRFSKWYKNEENELAYHLANVKNINIDNAKFIISLLNDKQKKKIKNILSNDIGVKIND